MEICRAARNRISDRWVADGGGGRLRSDAPAPLIGAVAGFRDGTRPVIGGDVSRSCLVSIEIEKEKYCLKNRTTVVNTVGNNYL